MQSCQGQRQTHLEKTIPGTLHFCCNICGHMNLAPMASLQREEPSCAKCSSTVRMRGIVHALSVALFGKSLSLPNFPERKSIFGKGMSDWDGYAKPLSKKLSYINTFYHKEPHLDITQIASKDLNSLDFIVSSDVFEHVAPPVSVAFKNARKMLRDNGVFVFSVPYTLEVETIEHFPNLYEFKIKNRGDTRVLVNRTREGDLEEFEDLVFHGGEGETLEVRVFSRNDLLKELHEAGFEDVEIMSEPYFEHGVYWPKPWSLPIIARCSSPVAHVRDWGPRTSRLGFAANMQKNGRSGLWLKVDSDIVSPNLSLTIGELSAENIVVNQDIITALIPKSTLETLGSHAVVLTIDNLIPVHVGDFLVYS
jgi:SAM-dependent methyltransferase